MRTLILTALVLLFAPVFSQNMGNFRVQEQFNQNESFYAQSRPGSAPSTQWPEQGQSRWQVSLLYNAVPSAQVAIFNVLQLGENAEEARRLASERINSFLKELENQGIPKEDLYVDFIAFIPVFTQEVEKKLFSRTLNEVPKGFELQQNVHVRFRDPAKLDAILGAATRFEIYDLLKVEYLLTNQSEILRDLRARAFGLLSQKLGALDSVGVELDSLNRTVEEDFRIVTPQERYLTFSANNSGYEALKRKTGASVSNQTVKGMYNRLSYHEFDEVIHPEEVKPMIQVVYHLKFVAPTQKAPQPASRYFWLTPDGSVTPVSPK